MVVVAITVVPVRLIRRVHDVLAGLRVEVAGGLVGQQHQRPVENAGDRDDAAAHLAGQPGGQPTRTLPDRLTISRTSGTTRLMVSGCFADHPRANATFSLLTVVSPQQPEVLEHAADHLPKRGCDRRAC